MSHHARITWLADEPNHKYSRDHRWDFDSGISVPASASPEIVPNTYVGPKTIDPEEAFIAAIASCHMLWFLHIAHQNHFFVQKYGDEVQGVMGQLEGTLGLESIFLNPLVRFWPTSKPDLTTYQRLHQEAHSNCFLAKSIRCQIKISAKMMKDQHV